MKFLQQLRQRHRLAKSSPLVMGILNVTPDSFSDGGRLYQEGVSIDHLVTTADAMLEAGVHILDIGGESTRPGAEPVSEAAELQRVIPAITALKSRFDCCISIDTSRASVMQAAIEAGADMINDVRALSQQGAMNVAIRANVPVCLMHMQGTPSTMQDSAAYDDVVTEVMTYLNEKVKQFVAAGGSDDNVILDPGFGFGKSLEHNVALFNALPVYSGDNYPILVGVSRKSMLGQITGQPVENRVSASVSAALLAAQYGAAILRVHDVAETVDALKVLAVLGDKK